MREIGTICVGTGTPEIYSVEENEDGDLRLSSELDGENVLTFDVPSVIRNWLATHVMTLTKGVIS